MQISQATPQFGALKFEDNWDKSVEKNSEADFQNGSMTQEHRANRLKAYKNLKAHKELASTLFADEFKRLEQDFGGVDVVVKTFVDPKVEGLYKDKLNISVIRQSDGAVLSSSGTTSLFESEFISANAFTQKIGKALTNLTSDFVSKLNKT